MRICHHALIDLSLLDIDCLYCINYLIDLINKFSIEVIHLQIYIPESAAFTQHLHHGQNHAQISTPPLLWRKEKQTKGISHTIDRSRRCKTWNCVTICHWRWSVWDLEKNWIEFGDYMIFIYFIIWLRIYLLMVWLLDGLNEYSRLLNRSHGQSCT